jgi:hypothetical protein
MRLRRAWTTCCFPLLSCLDSADSYCRDSGFTVLFHESYHVSQVNCMVLKHELWFSAWEPRTVGFLLHSFFA